MSFSDLFDWFDHVYIVNLPNRADRRAETTQEFARTGVAIPNDHVTFFAATRPTDKGEFPSLGSLGNMISQTRVLADALENGHDRVLICEDDLHLLDVAPDAVAAVLSDLQTQPWTIALLGYLEPEIPPTGHTGLINWYDGTLGVQFWAIQGREKIQAFHDYLVAVRNRPSGHPDGGSMFFDAAFNMVRTKVPGTEFRLATPNLAGQRSSRTDIHALKFYDRIEPFKTIAGLMRRVLNRRRRD
ncbi:hypothetical protein [Shimia sp. Alg240-R146]|uniref:hypothetical protein n=1 Tax=Shimia sp. Alg240-R146 TaxID=2993449 RepID=UPI0022E0ED43|nr:hypothetical protein [Shimia sp. Alg240-R146]